MSCPADSGEIPMASLTALLPILVCATLIQAQPPMQSDTETTDADQAALVPAKAPSDAPTKTDGAGAVAAASPAATGGVLEARCKSHFDRVPLESHYSA